MRGEEVPPSNIGSEHIKTGRTKGKLAPEMVAWNTTHQGNKTGPHRGSGKSEGLENLGDVTQQRLLLRAVV